MIKAGRHPFEMFIKDIFRYAAASAAALMFDLSTIFIILNFTNLHYLVATGAGFIVGLLIIYLVSTTVIFINRRKLSKEVEFASFVITGIIGLALNQAMISGFVDYVGTTVFQAKAISAILVFFFNFLARRSFIFKSSLL